MGRLVVAVAAFAMTGFFAAELNHRRRMLTEHLAEREKQIHLRREAEQRLRILIETSPLAILTLNTGAKWNWPTNPRSQLLGFDERAAAGAAR